MATITNLYARHILDSRATPTLEVICLLSDGSLGAASVPSGTSTGSYEAHELRDGDPSHYWGMGVAQAIHNVNATIAQKLIGTEIKNVDEVDSTLISLDATPNKSSLGANATLGVSLAVCKAIAASRHTPLYRYIAAIAHNDQPLFIATPLFNTINGGKHGAGNLDFQEFYVIPQSKNSFARHLEIGATTYNSIKTILARRGLVCNVGYEGGFTPNLFTNSDALVILREAVTACGLDPNQDVDFGLDIAANSFYANGHYTIKDRPQPLTGTEFIGYLKDFTSVYPLKVLEDPLHEDAWEDWASLTQQLGTNRLVIGDDLLATNESRVQTAIIQKSCNTVMIKPNQIGTLSETIKVVQLAKSAGWQVVVAHRSGETNDTFIADFSVGVGADYVKFGAPARGERVAKYNRLLAIETELLSR